MKIAFVKHRVQVKKHPLSYYVNLLESRSPFSFARYGDGEWLTILGYIGRKNSNGCTFTQHLCDCLHEVLLDNNPYYHTILRVANRKLGMQILDFLDRRGIDISWVHGDIFLDQSLKGNIHSFIEAMRKYRILYVGPKHCKGLNKLGLINYVDFIQPPPINAIEQRDEIVKAIQKSIVANKINLIGYSSGLHTKVFINDIWKYTGGRITQIDNGSMFDGYFKIPSRSYIRRGRVDFDDLLLKNTGAKV